MAYMMFLVMEIAGGVILFGTWKGVFSISIAFLAMLVMLTLSFHVLARNPRPDSTSIRMACFAAAFGYGAILAINLVFEFRNWTTTICAGLFGIATLITAIAATWSVLERPAEVDFEDFSDTLD